jgi:hypothetical protein
MLYAFSVSKFTFYYRDILQNSHESPMEFNELCGNGIVDYMSWIESFFNLASPLAVCVIYETQGEKMEVTEFGYSLKKKMTEEEPLSGIRSYPCIFSYPPTVEKSRLMQYHWPNLLSLIMDNRSDLDNRLDSLSFSDARMNSSYYICKTDQRMYLCTIFEPILRGKPKTERITHEFMFHMNMFLRNQKLFGYLI